MTSTTSTGPELVRPGQRGYEAQRAGFNTAVGNHPAAIVEARGPADIVAAVRLAAREGRPVAVMNTGHGPSVPADGAVLVRTGRLRGVAVDPARRTARIGGGAAWADVIAATAPHGLAPLNGSSPHVGVAGYTLGGGVGLLGRRYGFAADHVRWIELVTADGRHRRVSADGDGGGADGDGDGGELFWALRGAGANFGVVTAMEVDLFPVATLVGGELAFGADLAAEVLHTYVDWAAGVPETMASSVLLLRYPDDPAVPAELRGRHVTHVRVAFCGDDEAEGWRRVERLRRIGPRIVDSVRVMPYAEVGTIHHEPVDEPVAAFDRNRLLRGFDHDAAAILAGHAGEGSDFLVELRAWGGALSRPPAVPNAVGCRGAAWSLLGISDPEPANRAARDDLLARLGPWATGTTFLNFNGVEDTSPGAVRRSYDPATYARLRRLKSLHDPDNLFRINFNIPPP